eukprot:365993-Chlamydomonas_euryale.AAC.1
MALPFAKRSGSRLAILACTPDATASVMCRKAFCVPCATTASGPDSSTTCAVRCMCVEHGGVEVDGQCVCAEHGGVEVDGQCVCVELGGVEVDGYMLAGREREAKRRTLIHEAGEWWTGFCRVGCTYGRMHRSTPRMGWTHGCLHGGRMEVASGTFPPHARPSWHRPALPPPPHLPPVQTPASVPAAPHTRPARRAPLCPCPSRGRHSATASHGTRACAWMHARPHMASRTHVQTWHHARTSTHGGDACTSTHGVTHACPHMAATQHRPAKNT